MNLRLLLIYVLCFNISIFSNAQDSKSTYFTTAKEVIDKYIEVVGYSVTPYQSIQEININGSTIGGKTSISSILIGVVDITKETIASIMFNSEENSIVRVLMTKEKSYYIDENGNTKERPSMLTRELLGIKDLKDFYNFSLLSDREVFDNDECYVLFSENETINKVMGSTAIHKVKVYNYYSVKTGLARGSKMETTSTKDGKFLSSYHSYSYFKDYILIDSRYLLPERVITTPEKDQFSSTITSLKKYNIDTEQFKNEAFKNPREAISAIPDKF